MIYVIYSVLTTFLPLRKSRLYREKGKEKKINIEIAQSTIICFCCYNKFFLKLNYYDEWPSSLLCCLCFVAFTPFVYSQKAKTYSSATANIMIVVVIVIANGNGPSA